MTFGIGIHSTTMYKMPTHGHEQGPGCCFRDAARARILAEGESYGYAIIKRVAELSGGHLQWTDGMLYPVLHRLERQGHVAAKWGASENGRKRKYYRITKEGRAQLAAHREQWKAVDGTLRGIWMQACTV